MKLIDREPTQEMKAAGQAVIDRLANDGIRRHWQDVYAEGFKAMYDAAPEIQQEPVAWASTDENGKVEALGFNQSRSRFTTPLFVFPPDAQTEISNLQTRLKGCTQEYERVSGRFDELQAEIAKRDERIAELEKKLKYEGMAANAEARRADKQADKIESLTSAGAEYQRQCFEQADRIKELEQYVDNGAIYVNELTEELTRLAAQNQQLREALSSIQRYGLDTLSGRLDGPDDREWQRVGVNELTKRARIALALPDLATPVLNRVKAEALRSAADGILVGETWITREAADYWLRLRAYAIEKGEALAAIKEVE